MMTIPKPREHVAGVGGGGNPGRMFIYDKNSRQHFLVDTGANVLLIHSAKGDTEIDVGFKIYATNNTPIITNGSRIPRT